MKRVDKYNNPACPHSSKLAAYVASATQRKLPDQVVKKTKAHLLDTLGAIISGSRLKAGRVASSFVASLGGPAEASLPGTSIAAPAINAAFGNAMSAHADETADSHAVGRFHPGCAVVPAALAIAERMDKAGLDLLRAVACGYDVGVRFTIALGFTGPRTGTHSTHCLGANFGAAAAAGALVGLSPDQVHHIISYAVQQASGIPYWQRDPDHVEKAFDFGAMGARNGVMAALMVSAGFTGVSNVFSGPHSYLSAFAERATPEALSEDLGVRFEIMRASIKKWSVGSPIQAALDSLTGLISEHGLTATNVREIIAHMPSDRLPIVDNRDMPDICLQHLLAVALADGTVTFAAAHDEARMADPRLLEIRKRITVVPSTELTEARPERQAIVEIIMSDGRQLRRHTKAVRGTPENPMKYEEVEAKAEDLIGPVLGAQTTRSLISLVRRTDDLESVRELRALWMTRATVHPIDGV